MTLEAENLIRCLIYRLRERNEEISLGKILCIVYLFDVEYYRVHRETFTKFEWIFGDIFPEPSNDDLTEINKLIGNYE